MNEFKNYHPTVAAAYFAAVIGFSMVLTHPVCLAVSLAAALGSAVISGDRRALRFAVFGALPAALIFAAANPLFSHEGASIIAYFPNGNPLTVESIYFGLAQGAMLGAVLLHFSALNRIMTSDKLMYLTGRLLPSLSLIISMTLRFVPHFSRRAKKISDAQKNLGTYSGGGIIVRLRGAVKIFSVLISQSLEGAIDTADSMKSRGFGCGRRGAFSNYRITDRDRAALVYIFLCLAYLIFAYARGSLAFRCYPTVRAAGGIRFAVAAAVWAILCFCPIIIEIWEAYRWKKSQLKI